MSDGLICDIKCASDANRFVPGHLATKTPGSMKKQKWVKKSDIFSPHLFKYGKHKFNKAGWWLLNPATVKAPDNKSQRLSGNFSVDEEFETLKDLFLGFQQLLFLFFGFHRLHVLLRSKEKQCSELKGIIYKPEKDIQS